jgi:hypothetical protein
MRRTFCLTTSIICTLMIATSAQPRGQDFGRAAESWCVDTSDTSRPSHCEVREQTLAGTNPIDVDAGRNGGICVRGWDRADVLVRARIVGYADTYTEARNVVAGVRLETAGGRVRAEGPDGNGDNHWSVSFEVQVPRYSQLTLNTYNGGISIDTFRGSAQFRAHNGGVVLTDVDGDIRGETTNGGLQIDLTGDQWNGAGLDVETQNGGIRITLPALYSAQLMTGTTNGRINIDFPVTVQGTVDRRHIETTLGAGGARLRAMTMNGGVTIRRQ